jgi:hypothetical protein
MITEEIDRRERGDDAISFLENKWLAYGNPNPNPSQIHRRALFVQDNEDESDFALRGVFCCSRWMQRVCLSAFLVERQGGYAFSFDR